MFMLLQLLVLWFGVVAVSGLSFQEKTKRKQASVKPPSISLDKPKHWDKEKAGYFLHPSASIVDVSETERGFCIGGADGIPPNDVLLAIKPEQIIRAERAYGTPVGKEILKKMSRGETAIDDQTWLVTWLCNVIFQWKHGRGVVDADTATFLGMLPSKSDMKNFPIYWSDDELLELEGSPVKLDVETKQTQARVQYNEFAEMIPLFGRQTDLDTFLWARACVQSRTFILRDEQFDKDKKLVEKRLLALIPYGDMFNHKSKSDPTTCDWRFEQGAFVVRATGQLEPGAEACISYGRFSNSYWLSCYGFALERNYEPNGASPNDARIELSLKHNLSRSFAITVGDVKAAKALLRELRMSFTTENKTGQGYDDPLSLEHERAAMSKLKQSLERAIGRYKTTLEQDLKLLASKYVTGNLRNAVLVRSGEKQVLRHWHLLCDASLFFLDDVSSGKKSWSEYCSTLERTLCRVTSIAECK